MMKRLLSALCLMVLSAGFIEATESHPNILWIYAEDTSPWMGCYGSEANAGQTPNIDSIAEQGVIFNRAFVPAPVCSACRSAMIVGQSQIRFGAHEHRSGRGAHKIHLPKGVKPLPIIMNEQGYSTFNFGKTDYNFVSPEGMYTIGREKGKAMFAEASQKQPFFGQIQTGGGKTNTRKMPADRKTDPASVTVPADYPQNDLWQKTVAQHHDAIRLEDDRVGKILESLKEAGLVKNTIVVYFSDHGANNLLRHKQMPTEGGLHVPFVVMGPERYVPLTNRKRNDMVNMLDLTATTLSWAGIEQPKWYEGQNLFATEYQPRTAVFAGKDRLDHTIDRVRSVRTEDYRYTRNYKTDRIFLQPQYRDSRPEMKNMHALYQAGKLAPHLKDIYFGERPHEELYKVSEDPAQITNLVNSAKAKIILASHRTLLDEWLAKGDMGAEEEPIVELKENGDAKHWGIGVNPEYEVYREDSDGDGLSDIFEKTNGRDPNDGLLNFTFDCGGWQTEGWTSTDIHNNLAGYLGYLEFTLDKNEGTISREGFKVQVNEADEYLLVRLKADQPFRLSVSANGKVIHSVAGEATKGFVDHHVVLNKKSWAGSIHSLELKFHQGQPGCRIEVDRIGLVR